MLKVMVVDDIDISRREIKRLRLWGPETGFIVSEEACNGQEALAKLQAASIDLVITDIKMPKVDGIELLRKIMEKNLCPCVVLLSDHSEFSYARQGLVLGAFDYMTKPVNQEEFLDLLQRAREFIIERRKEQERVKQLVLKLGEQVGVFVPAADVKHITELILHGDSKAIEAAARMVEVAGTHLDYDLIKVESVLKNIVADIMRPIQERYPWLDKFISTEIWERIDFSQCGDMLSIKAELTRRIEKLVAALHRLNCGQQDHSIVSQVCKCVLENIDTEVSLKIVADILFMNKTYISETFKQKTGMSFVEYLTVVKMERAKKLIHEGRLKIFEIAERLGYKDIEYFSRLFKKHTGVSPTEFRQINIGKI